MEENMKATRHNGRSGKHGSYNPKHNDRNFNLEHSEHIDTNMAMQNVYWDCYAGKRTATSKENYESFDAIELRFYEEHYEAFVQNQNERNAVNRHTERNRSIEDIYHNKKTCPEESIYQLGNMDGYADPKVLMQVAEEFFQWFDRTFGKHVKMLDWALHVDEATPHIHERHVFEALNNYGELAPQQDKALELLGFELPHHDKPKSKSNNRKIVFDATCRKRFLEICEEYGLSVEQEAEYGGRKYLEKNDFIIQNQKERLSKVNAKLVTQKKQLDVVSIDMAAINTVMDCIADTAYSESCKLVIGKMVNHMTNLQVNDMKKEAEESTDEAGFAWNSLERRAIRKVVTDIVFKLQDAKDRLVSTFTSFFLGPTFRGGNVELLKKSIWNRMEELAATGPNDEEIVLSKDIPSEKKDVVAEQIADQVQEVATQMIRRGRRR